MSKKFSITINIYGAIEVLNEMKSKSWYRNSPIKDKAAFQFAIDYLEKHAPKDGDTNPIFEVKKDV